MSRSEAQTVTLNPLRLMPSSRPLQETPMSSLNQFTSKSHGRAMRQSEPVADRTRRHWLATTAATLIGVAGIALAPAVIAKDRHDVAHWVGTWSSSPQAGVAPHPDQRANGAPDRAHEHRWWARARAFVQCLRYDVPGHRLCARGHQRRWRTRSTRGPTGCSSSMGHQPSPFPPVRWR